MPPSRDQSRIRIEQKAKVKDLTQDLDEELQLVNLAEAQKQETRKINALKIAAWVVLLAAIGLAVLPSIGSAWILFYFSLSYYLWQGFVGLGVVLGVIAALGALYVIIFK